MARFRYCILLSRIQPLGIPIGAGGDRAVHCTRELAAINKLSPHRFLHNRIMTMKANAYHRLEECASKVPFIIEVSRYRSRAAAARGSRARAQKCRFPPWLNLLQAASA